MKEDYLDQRKDFGTFWGRNDKCLDVKIIRKSFLLCNFRWQNFVFSRWCYWWRPLAEINLINLLLSQCLIGYFKYPFGCRFSNSHSSAIWRLNIYGTIASGSLVKDSPYDPSVKWISWLMGGWIYLFIFLQREENPITTTFQLA